MSVQELNDLSQEELIQTILARAAQISALVGERNRSAAAEIGEESEEGIDEFTELVNAAIAGSEAGQDGKLP